MSAASLIPGLWVLIWAGSFVSAHVAAPHTEPLGFLAARFVLSAGIFAAMARLAGKSWPTTWPGWRDALVVGALLHGVYLSCMFYAMWHGLPAGVAALVGGLQPLVTAAASAPVLGERVRANQWLGIVLGFAGVGIVVAPSLGHVAGFTPVTVTMAFIGMLTFTAGTFFQKRSAALDLRVSAAIQFMAATAVTAPLALLLEHGRFDGSWRVWASFSYFVLVTSIGGTALLLVMIKRGALARVAALLYLVAPAASVLGYLILGQTLTMLQVFGMAIAVVGVAIARRTGTSPA